MSETIEYLTDLTADDYWADRREFKGCDARYDDEETRMEGKDFYTTGITYMKRQSFCNEKATVWGTWCEETTVRYEPITEVVCSVKVSPGMYNQTVKEVGRREFWSTEYFAYGKGFKHSNKSKYIRSVKTVMYE
jgi:hypothetical protein